jgi:hypothetical protein
VTRERLRSRQVAAAAALQSVYLYDLCPVSSFSGFVSIRNLWTKIVSAGTPLQRMRSDGQAFKPAPEPGALPKHACNPLVKFVGVILLFGFYSSNAWG